MKTLRLVYNQLSFVLLVIYIILVYKNIILLNASTLSILAITLILILVLGKVIPKFK